ncbi:Hypothetical protein CINCED_3A021954 [Cinara cedri]|nr:Hypothetical protein CINCED_3A021954 [Cinara cedri]
MRQLHPTAELNEFLDNKIHSECVDSTCPSDNGNKIIEQADPILSRRPSSPFNNGLTEVLICKDGTESNNRLKAVDETIETQNRSRRRSGNGLVRVGSDVGTLEKKRAVDDVTGETLDMMVMMTTIDNGPHREMAVDVPDSFIARNKTPPRYPPPSRANRNTGTQNGSVVPAERHSVPPPPPPRSDAIKQQQLQQACSINNNTIVTISSKKPTPEQEEIIKKYQDAKLRKQKEEEEKAAQFRNGSVRGSKKLRELEHEPPESGIVNDGFLSEHEEDKTITLDEPHDPYEPIYRVVEYGELIAALQRIHLQLKKNGIYLGNKSDPGVSVIQSLLLNPEFVGVLSVHNKVQQLWPPTTTTRPVTLEAQNLVRDCVESIQNSDLTEASELAKLLSQYEIEGVLWAHDTIAQDILPQDEATTELTVTLPINDAMYSTDQNHPPNIIIINIEKTNEPLGATVRNDGDAVIIGRIVRGGAAEKSGLLHEGDEVLEVNGVEMRGKSINDVCDILSVMTGPLTFMIVPSANRVSYQNVNGSRENLIMHMKAHFDYDPEDDGYIPCRELGISFQKGDILHVISQEDANWWQAFREGEEDQTLAGLIPSKSFQHQREALKQTITGDKPSKDKPKKQNTFLCGKKNLKKRKKKSLYQDGGYPIYSSSTSDEYEIEEILTYEEVALYYPRANHRRPIVLIGPPNIGRHELRQRLMEDRDRFAAAIPHTSRARKEGEVDGQDYHFITRVQFESDILSRKFVEHGEYEKAYYGTSLDAIRSVVNYSKICVLNLHPQSLKILRTSDLKPFVVFVAPPSLEKLRQKRLKNGEPYKEEELKEIIEKAREMEDKFGHYFDMIIINNDTERAYHQLLNEINSLEREPQWVPATWVKTSS